MSDKELLNKLSKYCAYQERSVHDVMNRLNKYQVDPVLRSVIIEKLKLEGFLNEERFARLYTLGKLKNNHWGKIKIIRGLKNKRIENQIIDKVIKAIDETEYVAIIDNLIKKKENHLRREELFIRKHKIARFMLYKGFESDIVWDRINNKLE